MMFDWYTDPMPEVGDHDLHEAGQRDPRLPAPVLPGNTVVKHLWQRLANQNRARFKEPIRTEHNLKNQSE